MLLNKQTCQNYLIAFTRHYVWNIKTLYKYIPSEKLRLMVIDAIRYEHKAKQWKIIKYAYSNALEHEKVTAYYSPISDATSKLILTCFCFFGKVNSNQFDWESQTDRQTEIERETHGERRESYEMHTRIISQVMSINIMCRFIVKRKIVKFICYELRINKGKTFNF